MTPLRRGTRGGQRDSAALKGAVRMPMFLHMGAKRLWPAATGGLHDRIARDQPLQSSVSGMPDNTVDIPCPARSTVRRATVKRNPRMPVTAKGVKRIEGISRPAAPGEAWAEHARAAIILGGVPETTVVRAEHGGKVDWRALAGEIDGLSMAGGHFGVRRFWRTPHPELAGRTPLDALDGPSAVRRLAELVRDRATAISRARVGA
jgi:hypothetical protein